ncbi:cation channel sperm-associated targeting subunit tau isoform X32 [Equus przewalskii]|uniref:Cation channel sperm-associated targeting subunit tau isoform X32 n=1 Tax=Equus przewalskii TaxID=9798 RepID=A0ABM4L8M2_EQUPR
MEPPRETAKVANAAVNHGGRVHSHYVAPILQRGPHTNLETVHSRASFSSARNSPEHGKSAALPKDQAKEGAAHRLLNMLRKTLKGSESKEVEVTPEAPTTLVPFGDVVPRRQDDERNNIYLELMQYDNTEKYPVLLGSVQAHLYEVIQFICRMEVEFIFSYGNFGYGFSHQLKPLQKVIEPSMFMNIAPPPERTDPLTNVILPQPVEYPAFLSPDLNVTVGKPTTVPASNQPSVVRLEKLQQQPRERLEKMKKEYRNLSTWIEKASYIEGVLTPKLESKEPKGSNTNEVLESQLEEKPEDIVTSDVPLIKEKAETIPSESPPGSFRTMNENLNLPNYINAFMKDTDYGWKNSNRKGKSVAFSPEEYISPSFRPEYKEFKPKYQFQKFNIKDSFDPFLRNINDKMSVRKKKDGDTYKCGSILSAEVIEHEDQDPPYPTQSKTARPTNKTWPQDLNITVKPLDTKKKLAHDPGISTVKTLDAKNKLKKRLQNLSLPNFEGESSVTGNGNTHLFSKSLSFPSHIENLKQSMVLKSILSKNLQDLSDKLFSKTEVPMDTEARKKNHGSSLLSVHAEPPSSLEDKVFEKIQDLNSWLSEGTILNSKTLLSQIIKDVPADSLSEGAPGSSSEVEKRFVSETHLETGETDFTIKKKRSFKKKHLKSEGSSSKPSLNSIVHDYLITQIFTAPVLSDLEIGVQESSGTQMNLWTQLPTAWESVSSNSLVHYEDNDDEIELPQAKSVISQIIQSFPIDTLLESGIIKVIELGEENQKTSLLDTETVFAEEKPKDSTEDYSEIKGKSESLSGQNIPTIPKEITSFFNKRVELIDEGQNISQQDSKYQSTPDKKTDLPSNGQRLNREENYLSSTSENLSNSLMGKLNESDVIMLKSFVKNMFNVFFKYSQSERRQPEKELERLIQHPFPNKTNNLEEIRKNFDEADKLDRKPILSPKLRVFLEELSESEIKNLKSELSKHIQHYLVERLSESGHITKEDLPTIYQNLYLMNEKAQPKGQNIFLEKYSETVKEILSFVNNFNRHFIDKHLEIKLRSFLNEILQNYFLKNLSQNSLFKDTESEPVHSNISSRRNKSASISFPESGQDISRGSFGRRLEMNMKYPLNQSLQNYLIALSENEILNLKADLSKHLQRLFIDKLSKAGLITKRQLEGINQDINLINSSSTPLKCIKPGLSFRSENQFMEEHSEKQKKHSKIVQKTTLQKVPEDKLVETKLTRKEGKEYFSLQNIKENPSIIREQKRYYPKEGTKTLSLIKAQPSSNKNTQEIPLNKSSERLSGLVLKKQRKEYGFMQLPRGENFDFKTEIQDPQSWSSKSKIPQSNACSERTLKTKSLEKKGHNNIHKLLVQEKPEAVLSPFPGIPNCKMPNDDKEYVNKVTIPSTQNTSTHFTSNAGEKLKLGDQYCQRLKGNNNNNKKQHLVTFAHYKKEIQTLYIKPNEICDEKCVKIPESQSFKYKVVEAEKNSKPALFPQVLEREVLKPKVRKERDHVSKPEKSFSKIVRTLPATLPAPSVLRKSVPRTLLHWKDCLDRFEDSPVTSFKHLVKGKSRVRLIGKNPGDIQVPDPVKYSARPYTAPDGHQRREGNAGKFTSPRMVSAGLLHVNDTISDYEIHKMRQKKKLKDNIEKHSLICDIIQMLTVQNDT